MLEGLTYTLLGGVLGMIMAIGLITLLELIPTEGNEALEMLGKPTLSVPIALGNAGVLGIDRPAGRLLPRAACGVVDPAETLRYE